MTTSDRAVRKASGKRLLTDMRLAAQSLALFEGYPAIYLNRCAWETSRTRYACLMTAFGL